MIPLSQQALQRAETVTADVELRQVDFDWGSQGHILFRFTDGAYTQEIVIEVPGLAAHDVDVQTMDVAELVEDRLYDVAGVLDVNGGLLDAIRVLSFEHVDMAYDGEGAHRDAKKAGS